MANEYGHVVRLSPDLLPGLEKIRAERFDKNIAQTARALLREILCEYDKRDVK